MTHTPRPQGTLKERRSCSCCQHYRLRRQCPVYPECKGSPNYLSAPFWDYSAAIAAATVRWIRERRDGVD